MIKKTVIGVCGLVFWAALSLPAFADQSIGYQEYFNEGVKAFKEHDDQKALRCFKIAQIYDPTDEAVNKYIHLLQDQAGSEETPETQSPPEGAVGYKYYLALGIGAFQKNEINKAVHYFNLALIFNPDSTEADQYLRTLSSSANSNIEIASAEEQPRNDTGLRELQQTNAEQEPQTAVEQPQAPAEQAQAPAEQPAYVPPVQKQNVPTNEQSQGPIGQITVKPEVQQPTEAVPQQKVPVEQQAPVESQEPQATSMPGEWPQPSPAAVPHADYYVTAPNPKQPPVEISLYQLKSTAHAKPTLMIDLNSSVILDGNNIQRLLVVDEGFIGIKTLGLDRLEIDALRIGKTFLHIWDNTGRHTLYVEVVFPKIVISAAAQQALNGIQHSQPFIVTYTNDWNSYYSGKNIRDLKRQSYEFDQTLATKGETPYGFFDASGSYNDYGAISEFETYTVGLSQIPLEGTSNFNIRAFDALRYLSPLTMPSTRLRGAFADIDLFDNNLGLSISHGQEQEPLGFIPISGTNQFLNSYIDAFKLTLFPKSDSDQYSFNYATAYGTDLPTYLTTHVYSVEGQHKFNDFLTLNAEEGSDTSHDSTLASLHWQDGMFKSGLNFRNIDKDYSTISTLPANQGETGAAWTTDTEFKNFTETSFFEAYQDHLYSNPDDPRALNYDGNGNVRIDVTPSVWLNTDVNYVDTAGELSPSRSFGIDQRISKSFGIWNAMKGTVFSGVGYQNSHSSDSDITDYDRESVIAGIQLPLNHQVSAYANYEYDWLDQPDSGGNSNPSVVNAGLQYQKQVTTKLSFTSQLDYHDELGVRSSSNTFLSGEESVIITGGFNYNPMPDINFYGDCNASKVLSHIGNPSYDDFEVHLGVRLTFGGANYWDPLGTVSGIVFKDRIGNGKFSPGDDGIPGVKVKVGDKFAITDKYGRYRVKIRAKGVDVTPVLDTIPGGLIFSTPQGLNVRVLQDRETHADFGLIVQTGIYGLVFVDRNGSGVPMEGERFVGKVRVIMDGHIIQISDSHGAFYFRNVAPGKHVISFDINTLSINMVPLLKLKNEIDVAEGTNYMFNIPVKFEKAQGDQQ